MKFSFIKKIFFKDWGMKQFILLSFILMIYLYVCILYWFTPNRSDEIYKASKHINLLKIKRISKEWNYRTAKYFHQQYTHNRVEMNLTERHKLALSLENQWSVIISIKYTKASHISSQSQINSTLKVQIPESGKSLLGCLLCGCWHQLDLTFTLGSRPTIILQRM